MKRINLVRTFALTAVFAAFTLLFIGCSNDDEDDMNNETYSLSGSASGSQEVPAVTTSATGTIGGSYDARTNTLTYNINWSGLSNIVTGLHFHGPAIVGQEAGVIHPLTITTNGATGAASGTLTVADSTEAHLLAGKIYYNIHTVLNPDGEIRGQVTATDN